MVAIEKGEIEIPSHRIHRYKIPKTKVSRTKISLKKVGDKESEAPEPHCAICCTIPF